ncbi:MAG: hypothetical protein P8R54_12880 [Myxococcota bacterium]|nr:hypothetical protein [Myxococcota bacterium]
MTPLLLMAASIAATPRGSSTLRDTDGVRHTPDLAFDGLMKTGWAEGDGGYGEGSWLELSLDRKTPLNVLSIWPGDLSQGARSHREHSRPKLVRVLVDGEQVGEAHRLQDELKRIDLPLGGIEGRTIRLVIDEVFEGFVYSDLYIAEMAVNFPDAAPLTRMEKWLGSADAAKQLERHIAEVEADYFAHKEAEFGDEEAFARLCDAASDGPAYLASKAKSYVPMGYRVQAIQSSEKAREALRKLGDANAIPALEMAALRSHGTEQAAREEQVEIFYAYQELTGGPNLNVPYWGVEGWAPGALQSFGEPLAIVADSDTNLYVADTGNNRIQRFTDQGQADRQWGPGPDITNDWFENGRPWYVSGAASGSEAGRFVNPLDIEILPEKEGNGFAVLDAEGRIQIYDTEGRLTIGWTMDVRWPAEPKLGGQGYLTWLPKQELLIGIIGDEAIAYTLDSEEVSRFELEDGTPGALVLDKKGKQLMMAYGDEIILYNTDGFRFGSIIDLGEYTSGFESVDMTLDEDRRLWVITDTGWVYKFKKPGKLEFSIRVTERPLIHPRIAVYDGIMYMTSNNVIERVDVLQMLLDRAEAEEAAERKE